MSYHERLDDEILAFIAKTNAHYPPDAVALSIQQQRAVYDQMCAAFRVAYPAGVRAEDSAIPRLDHTGKLPLRHYTPEKSSPPAQLLYFHGGGFVVGGLESHDDACAELCAATGLPLTAVDYRLAPEYTHPAAFEDALAAFHHAVATRALPVILVGDSAGGTLAAAVSHATRQDSVKPMGQVLLYPALGGDKTKGSYLEHANAPMLSTKDMQFYYDVVSGEADTTADPRLHPLADTDFSGLPKTTVITAECDPLADDGRDYRDRMVAAGGDAAWFNEIGLVHGFLRARHRSARAAAGFQRAVAAINAIATLPTA